MNTRTCKQCNCSFEVDSIFSNRKFCSYQCRFKSIVPSSFKYDECSLWPKSCNVVTGYGQMNISLGNPSRMLSAHRISYIVFNGPLSDGEIVRHACDNRRCINPLHLVKGTQADNVSDMWSRSRQQDYSHARSAVGENNPFSKLTDDAVRHIRSSGEACKNLAERYGVCNSTIRFVLAGETWKHVDPNVD